MSERRGRYHPLEQEFEHSDLASPNANPQEHTIPGDFIGQTDRDAFENFGRRGPFASVDSIRSLIFLTVKTFISRPIFLFATGMGLGNVFVGIIFQIVTSHNALNNVTLGPANLTLLLLYASFSLALPQFFAVLCTNLASTVLTKPMRSFSEHLSLLWTTRDSWVKSYLSQLAVGFPTAGLVFLNICLFYCMPTLYHEMEHAWGAWVPAFTCFLIISLLCLTFFATVSALIATPILALEKLGPVRAFKKSSYMLPNFKLGVVLFLSSVVVCLIIFLGLFGPIFYFVLAYDCIADTITYAFFLMAVCYWQAYAWTANVVFYYYLLSSNLYAANLHGHH